MATEEEQMEALVEKQELAEEVEEGEEEEEDDSIIYDTSADFAEIFGQQAEFDSWDEFSTRLEEFSRKTGFYFKPRSACTVEYLNEKRINSPIPDRFMYAKVKMICVHFGDPRRSENGSAPRKGFNYVGKGCEAYMQVSYTKGALRIGKSHLVHKNHEPRSQDEGTPIRQFRSFIFSEDLDILIAREVLRNNPFELANGEKRWIQAIEILKGEDKRLINLTPRLVKKRIRFLIDKFLAVTHGRMPAPEDEMGNILYELEKTKKDRLDNPPTRGRKRKIAAVSKFSPRKASSDVDNGDIDYDDLSGLEDEDEGSGSSTFSITMDATDITSFENSDDSDGNFSDTSEEFITDGSDEEPRTRRSMRNASPPAKTSTGYELSNFLSYLRRKDEADRKLRQQELELSKEELQLRKREMEFQRSRFEFEKFERKAHLDLLKAQLVVLEKNSISMKQETIGKEREQPVEYTIVLDNNHHQAVVS